MSVLKRTCAKLLSVFRKTELDHDFDEEAQSHIALATDDSVQRGMPLAEAHRLARLRFGSIAASKDAHRDSRGLPWLDGFLFDSRLAVRGLRRDRAFALTSITLMALAIGLNVTVFTVMDAMLFRGYPLVNGNDRLVYLQERSASGTCCISYPDFEDWRAQAQSFQGMAFVASNRPISFRDSDGRPSDLLTLRVSANTFGLLGVPPMLGRDFVAADEDSGAAQVAILNHRFWDSRFARRPDIVGVMPEGFDFPMQETLWMPVSRTSEWLQRGPTPGGFRRVVTGVVPNIMQGDPTRQNFKPLVYVPFRQEASTSSAYLFVRASLPPAFAAIAVVLSTIGLYAIIAHSIGQRTKEFAVRMAIGAAAEDIRWMVLRDGMAPVAVGVIAGLAVSLGVNRLLQSQLVGVSPSDAVSVAGASLGLLLVALFACLNPARRAMNVAPAVALRHE